MRTFLELSWNAPDFYPQFLIHIIFRKHFSSEAILERERERERERARFPSHFIVFVLLFKEKQVKKTIFYFLRFQEPPVKDKIAVFFLLLFLYFFFFSLFLSSLFLLQSSFFLYSTFPFLLHSLQYECHTIPMRMLKFMFA